jgi:hypothetical protein
MEPSPYRDKKVVGVFCAFSCAASPNFNFEIGLDIISFNFKVVGYPTIVVQETN